MRNGGLADWIWSNPQPDGSHWETAIDDRYVIDFIMLSPALKHKIVSPPTVYAWYYDSNLGGSTEFHEGSNGSDKLKNYGVSDHRPVVVVMSL